jgi:hypothetical protein
LIKNINTIMGRFIFTRPCHIILHTKSSVFIHDKNILMPIALIKQGGLLWILARTPVILRSSCFLLSFQANVRIVPQLGPERFLKNPL